MIYPLRTSTSSQGSRVDVLEWRDGQKLSVGGPHDVSQTTARIPVAFHIFVRIQASHMSVVRVVVSTGFGFRPKQVVHVPDVYKPIVSVLICNDSLHLQYVRLRHDVPCNARHVTRLKYSAASVRSFDSTSASLHKGGSSSYFPESRHCRMRIFSFLRISLFDGLTDGEVADARSIADVFCDASIFAKAALRCTMESI